MVQGASREAGAADYRLTSIRCRTSPAPEKSSSAAAGARPPAVSAAGAPAPPQARAAAAIVSGITFVSAG